MSLKKYQETTCSCYTCKSMCEYKPCWPTPEEAQALIAAGYSDKLMLDWWEDPKGDIEILSPAIVGQESHYASSIFPVGRCTFLSKAGKCKLHSLELKPIEGRLSDCSNEHQDDLHYLVAKTWDNKAGRALVVRWKAERNL